MKLKSLLLGSAAAMIAVSGAQAADAPIAEPEPVEYVRVCDMYGSGWFYIPGTETCLSIRGQARVEYDYDTREDSLDGESSEGDWGYRARVNIQARNETDLGPLNSYIRLQGADNDPVDANVGVDRLLISLGGLAFGYNDTFWARSGVYGLNGAINDGFYVFDQSIMLEYTYSANGFGATIGLEQVQSGTDRAEDPNFYGGVRYGGSWGFVSAGVAYDSNTENMAYRVDAVVSPIEGLTLEAFYIGADGATIYLQDDNGITGGDYNWGVGVDYAVMDNLSVYALYTEADAGQDYFAVGAAWGVVPGLTVQPEVRIEDSGEKYHLRVVRNF
ncbi:MAG: porin [Pseudomonadota bacterium]